MPEVAKKSQNLAIKSISSIAEVNSFFLIRTEVIIVEVGHKLKGNTMVIENV